MIIRIEIEKKMPYTYISSYDTEDKFYTVLETLKNNAKLKSLGSIIVDAYSYILLMERYG